MLRLTTSAIICSLAFATSIHAQTASPEEAAAWAIAQESGTSAEVFAFIEAYPNGEFAKDAKAVMIDLLWVELAENNPTPSTEEGTSAPALPVTFNAPLTDGAPEIIGKTIAELIEGSPLFPPVEGLPEEYWKEQDCSNCHAWEQANLCTQANSYLSVAGAENLIKRHPYGGTFKLNLRNWADSGCE